MTSTRDVEPVIQRIRKATIKPMGNTSTNCEMLVLELYCGHSINRSPLHKRTGKVICPFCTTAQEANHRPA